MTPGTACASGAWISSQWRTNSSCDSPARRVNNDRLLIMFVPQSVIARSGATKQSRGSRALPVEIASLRSLKTHEEYHSRAGKKEARQSGPLSWSAVEPRSEDDLDPAVLRLAHAVCGRHALVVLATAADCHLVARDTLADERGGDRIGAAFGEPLVV